MKLSIGQSRPFPVKITRVPTHTHTHKSLLCPGWDTLVISLKLSMLAIRNPLSAGCQFCHHFSCVIERMIECVCVFLSLCLCLCVSVCRRPLLWGCTTNRFNVAWVVQAACATGRDRRRFHLFSCFRIDVITQSDVTSCRLIYWGVRQFLFKWLSVSVCVFVCAGRKLFPVSCFLSPPGRTNCRQPN